MSAHRQFGNVEVLCAERQLLVDGRTVALGARAFDVLLALTEDADRTCAKNELIERAWPGLVVEENNLQVQISTLRKALGAQAIATIPGRGYKFALASSRAAPPATASPASPASSPAAPIGPDAATVAPPPTNLPAQPAPLFGRDDDVLAVRALLLEHGVVSVAGAGGIGKTRLAQAVAAGLGERFPDGIWWIELAALGDGALVAAAVARPLGAHLGDTRSALESIVAVLAPQRALLVLDNCEHLVDAVADLVAAIRAAAPAVRILVTSQEPLKIAGEHVHRLGSLAVPPPGSEQGAAGFGAVELFVARARALDAGFAVDAARLPAIVEICARLDGIPLAIELAAARLPLLGLEGLRQRLDARFRVLTAGARVVLRRHQTLRATLEWSHNLLSADEQAVLRRLGVFAGSFTLESAQAVASDAAIDRWAVLDLLGTLVDKSLVLAEGDPLPRYRLLETTRAYALERLAEAGETERTLRLHAESLVALLRKHDTIERRWRSDAASRAALAAEVDNLRAAWGWAQSSAEDAGLLVELAGVSASVWIFASLNLEGIERCAALQARLGDDTPLPHRARFWLAHARLGIVTGRRDCYQAACRAAEAFRELGDEADLFDALSTLASIGSERGESIAAGAAIAEASRLERADFPPRQRASFAWTRARWLRAEGRTDEALASVLQQAALYRQDGFALGEAIAMGANVAAYEVQLGRLETAEARSRAAIEYLERVGAAATTGHVRASLANALVLQGKAAEAIEQARIALPLLRAEADEDRLLATLAPALAQLGRPADAARIAGFIDADAASAGRLWRITDGRHRRRLDELLGSTLTADQIAGLAAAGAALDLDQAFALAFEKAPPRAPFEGEEGESE